MTEAAESKKSVVTFQDRVATTRQVTKAEWKLAGVENQDTVIWNKANGYSVDASKLSKEALEVLKGEPGFTFPK
jgi:hypothetical protein